MREGKSVGNEACEVIVTEGFPLTVEVETPCETASGAEVVVEPEAEDVAAPVLVGRFTTRDEVGTHSKLFDVDELEEVEEDPPVDDDEESGAPVMTGDVAVPVGVVEEMAVPFDDPPPTTTTEDELEEALSKVDVAEDPGREVCSGRGAFEVPPTPGVEEVPFEKV